MAVEIQEPNDLPPNTITDDNADRYEILVYEQSADVAGIKRLAIAGWKNYLQFNTHKVNNVASYVGIPSTFPWDLPQDLDYHDYGTPLSDQVKNIADKLGVNTESQTGFPTILPRIETLENQVQTTDTGLLDRMTSAEGDINNLDTRVDSLAEEIGGSGGSGSTLTGRIEALETSVGNTTSPESGLLADVTAINDKIGTDTITGTITSNISTLNTDVNTLKETVDGDGTTTNPGLTNRVTTLETTVGDSTNGLVKDVDDLQQQVSDIASNVYRFVGNITGVDDPETGVYVDNNPQVTTFDELKNGNVFNIEPQGTATTIIIQGITYDANENIVWVTPEGGTAHFDKLGPNIDVDTINNLKTRVDALETTVGDSSSGLVKDVADLKTTVGDTSSGLVKTVNDMLWTVTADASWTSASIPNGIYQCSSVIQAAGSTTLTTFIIVFNGGSIGISTPIDISSNFADYWVLDGTGKLKIKSETPTRILSIHKIGEL